MSTSRWLTAAGSVALMLGLLTMSPAFSAEADSSPQILTLQQAARLLQISETELAALAATGQLPARQIGNQWRFSRDAIFSWINGDNPDNVTPSSQQRREPDSEANGVAIGERPAFTSADEVFLRRQKLLLAPLQVAFEVGQFYSLQRDRRLVQLAGGEIREATYDIETHTSVVVARMGVATETELFVGASYVHTDSELLLSGEMLESDSSGAVDRYQVGVRRTLLHEGTGHPNLIASLLAEMPDDESYRGAGGSLAMVKSLDPVVLYASVQYLSLDNQFLPESGQPAAEERVGLSGGYAFAVNDTITLSASLNAAFESDTTFEQVRRRAQKRYTAQFGLTAWLAPKVYIEPSISMGLGNENNAFAFGVSLPFSF